MAVAIARLDGLGSIVGVAETTAEKYRASRKAAANKARVAIDAEGLAEVHADKTREHDSRREGLSDALETARYRQTEIAECWDNCSARAHIYEESAGAVRDLRNREDDLRTKCNDAVEERNRLEKASALTREHLTIIQRADFAAAAAEGLHPGDDCPVCNSRPDSGWSTPTSDGLAGAKAANEKANRAVAKAREDAAEPEGKRKGIQELIPSAEEEAGQAESRYRQALAGLAKVVELDDGGVLPDRECTLEPYFAARATAECAHCPRMCKSMRSWWKRAISYNPKRVSRGTRQATRKRL